MQTNLTKAEILYITYYFSLPPVPHQVSLSLGSQLDFMATFAELSGTPLPNKTLDSHSLTSVLFSKPQGAEFSNYQACAYHTHEEYVHTYIAYAVFCTVIWRVCTVIWRVLYRVLYRRVLYRVLYRTYAGCIQDICRVLYRIYTGVYTGFFAGGEEKCRIFQSC